MAIYRYSAPGVEILAKRAAIQASAMTLVAAVSGMGIVATMGGERVWPAMLALVVVFVLVVALAWRAAKENARRVVNSTEVELDGEGVTLRNRMATITIPWGEIREVRRRPDGLHLRGTKLSQAMVVHKELEGFEDFQEAVASFLAGPMTPRAGGSGDRIDGIVWAAVALNLVVMYLAFTWRPGAVAVFFCVLEAVILLGCGAWIWRSEVYTPQSKRMSLVILIPVASLLGRAWGMLGAM